MPRSLADAGVAAAEFEAALPDLAEAAFADPSMRTNPRMPLVARAGRPAARRLGRPLTHVGIVERSPFRTQVARVAAAQAAVAGAKLRA